MKSIARVKQLAKYFDTAGYTDASELPAAERARQLRCSKRYFSQLAKAIPPWADDALIRFAYRLAKGLTKQYGVPYEVDHIVPVRHQEVCGLHCHQNLRVIPAYVNQRKSNRTWPNDWSDCQKELF